MSDATPTTFQPPSRGDAIKLIAQLRDDQTAEVRSEVADRLVVLAAHERHPLAKSALLERAANLVCETDPDREFLLLRESFRQHPRFDIGERLCAQAENDESLGRLGRLGRLFDAVAALAPEDERPWALLRAARAHVGQGHGSHATAALDALGDAPPEMGAEPSDLRQIAASQREDRHDLMTAKRMQIAEATGDQRGGVLLEYAQLLLAGDEPLGDASAVLADAIESGADRQVAAPLWAEVARAVGDSDMLGRALAASLDCDQPVHERLRTADELANHTDIDAQQPSVAKRALEVLAEALPNDMGIQARLLALRAISGDPAAEPRLEQLRLHTIKERDRDGEALICLAIGRVAIHRQDDAQAERSMRRVRTLDPRNNAALDFFEARFRDSGDVKRLYMVLSHRLPGATGAEAVRIARAMAELAENEMDSPERAIEAWHRVLGVAPDQPEASEALVRLYRASERWTDLRDALERRAAQAEARGDDAMLADALSQRAALHGPSGALAEPSASLTLWRRVSRVAPDHAGLDDAIEGALRAVGAWQELAERLVRRLSKPQTKADHAEAGIAQELLEITLESHDAPVLAGQALDVLVDTRQTDAATETGDALIERAARQLGHDRHLLAALRWRRARCTDDAAVEVLEEACALAAWALDDKPQAVVLFEDLRRLRPVHPAALRGLSRLYGEVDRADDQVATLDALLQNSQLNDDERADLLEELATAHADGRKDLDAANAVVATLIALRPNSTVGQRLAQRSALNRGDLEGLREALGAGKAGAAQYVEQVEALATELDGAAAVPLLRAAALAAATELDQAERATELCGIALLHTTDSEDDALATAVANELLGYAERAGDEAWAEQALATLACRGPEPTAVQRKLAERAERRDDWAEACSAWSRAITDDPSAEHLVSDTERLCDAAEQADALKGVVATVSEAAARHRDLSAETATAAVVSVTTWAAGEGVDLPVALTAIDNAIDAAALATGADGEPGSLLQARERVLVEQGAWGEVIRTLERLAATLDGEGKVDILRRAAGICDGVANDAAAAARLYAAVLERAPSTHDVWPLRLAACERAGDEAGIRTALDAFLGTTAGTHQARTAAALRRVELTDGDDHNAVLAAAAAILPQLDGARPMDDDEELVFIITIGRLDVPSHAHAAATLALPVARRYERWDDVLRCVELLGADAEPGSPQHVASLLDQAELAHAHADNGAVALRKLAEAIAVAPDDLDVWSRALLIADARADTTLDKLLDGHGGLTGGTAREPLLRLIAERAATTEDVARGVAAWRALRDLNNKTLEPHEALEALGREAGDLDKVAQVIEARLTAQPADDEREVTWLRLATLHADERQDRASGVDVLGRGLSEFPMSEVLWAARIDLAEGDTSDGIAVRMQRLKVLTADIDGQKEAERLAQHAQITQVHRELAVLTEDDAPAVACRHWLAVLEASPADTEAVSRAAAALLAQADPGLPTTSHTEARLMSERLTDPADSDLLDAVLQAWAAGSDEKQAVTLHLRRAAADPSQAFERLATALINRPGNATLIEALASYEGDVNVAARVEAWRDAAEAAPASAQTALRLRMIRAQIDDASSRSDALDAWAALWRAAPAEANFDGLLLAMAEADRTVDAQVLRLERLEDPPADLDARAERASLAADFAASGDPETARAQWQQLVFDDPTDILAVAALRDLATSPEELAEVDELLNVAGDTIEDPTARGALRRELAERALDRDAWSEAADLLDAALSDRPNDDEAFELRDLALGAMPPAEAGERLSAHLAAAIERASDEPGRRELRLRLVDHGSTCGVGTDTTVEVLRAALAEAPAEARIDLLAVVASIGEHADEHVLALLHATSSDADAAVAATAYRALAGRETDPERAADYALKAYNLKADADDKALLMAQWTNGARAAALVDTLWPLLDANQERAELLAAAVEHHGTATGPAWLAAWADADADNVVPRAIQFAMAPDSRAAWGTLTDTASSPEATLDALLGSLDYAPNSDGQALIFVRAADLAERGDDIETAAAYLAMALERRDDATLRGRRRELLKAAGADEGLAEALEVEAETATDDEERRALLEQALALWSGALADPARAVAVFARIKVLSPDDPALIVRGVALRRAAGDSGWREAAIATLSSPETTTAESRRMAIDAYLETDQLDAAIQLARILSDTDGTETLGGTLARLADEAEMLPEADALWVLDAQSAAMNPEDAPEEWASLKLRWLTRCTRVEDQLDTLDTLVTHAMGPLDDPNLAMDWRVRALLAAPLDRRRIHAAMAQAETTSRLEAALPAALAALVSAGDDSNADIAAFAAVFDRDEEGVETAETLVKRGRADADFATLAVTTFAEMLTTRGLHRSLIGLRRAALAGTSGAGRVSGLIALADGVASQGDLSDAISSLLDGCNDVDDPAVLIERATDLAADAGAPKTFVEAVERQLGGSRSGTPALDELLVQTAAASAAADLDDPSRAADLYNLLWERDPDSLDARDAVLALRRDAGVAEALIDDLDRALMQGGSEMLELRVELAGLLIDADERTSEALRHLKAVLREEPTHDLAATHLERVAGGTTHVGDALRTLELAYRAQKDWPGVQSVLRRRIAETGPDAAAARQLGALADVLENHLDEAGLAAEIWARLVIVKPTTLRVRTLLRLAPSVEDPSQLASAWTAALASTLSDADRTRVLEAQVDAAVAADDGVTTEALLRDLVAMDPGHDSAWEQLDSLLEDANRWPELVAALHQRIAATSSEAMRIGLQHRLAGVASASGQQQDAIAAYEALAAADPDSPDALEALSDLLADAPPEQQCDVLERWATRLPRVGSERASVLLRAARLCAGPLVDPERAAKHYLQAFDLDPADDESFRYVERRAQDDPSRLQKLYRRRAEGVPAGPARVVVLRKLAVACVDLGKTAEARAALEAALGSDETNEVLHRELIAVCEDAGDVKGFQRAATHRLKFEVPRVERVMLVRKLARHAVEQGEAADRWLTELNQLAPNDPELSALRGLVQARSEDPATAAAGLERMIEQVTEPPRQVEILSRLAKLYETALEQPTRAMDALQRLLKVEPSHWWANERLCTLYAARGSQEALTASLQKWADATDPSEDGRAAVLGQLGAAYLRLGRGAEAATVLEEAYALTKDDITINLPLVMVWTTLGRLEEAADLQTWVVDRLRRTRERAQLPAAAARAGMLCERVGRHKDARKHYRTALKGTPNDVDATLGLARVSALLGDDARAMVEFEKVAAMAPRLAEKADRAQALCAIGQLHKKLGRIDRARSALTRALELEPDLAAATDALRSL